jgi:hypothetical protein
MPPRPRSASSTYRFLKRHQASPETDPGSVSLRCLFGGNYVVPPSKYDTFLELYAGDAGEYALGLVEVKRDGSFPFVLDVDFPEDHPGDRWRQVHDILRNMQVILGGVLSHIRDNDDDQDLVFREAQIAHRRGLKFHVVFPSIVTTSAWAVRRERVCRLSPSRAEVSQGKSSPAHDVRITVQHGAGGARLAKCKVPATNYLMVHGEMKKNRDPHTQVTQ